LDLNPLGGILDIFDFGGGINLPGLQGLEGFTTVNLKTSIYY
jgi:hypothetical protein